jgi:transcriptional regulator with XRE-family HTH domain
VGQFSGPVGFGVYLRNAIRASGFGTPTHFARAVGTDPSVVLRWINEEQRPTIRSIERIAPTLGLTINEMVAAAYPDRTRDQPTEPPPLHPLARELSRMVANDSPLSTADRESLISMLDDLLEPYRRDLRRRRSR